MQKKAFTQTQTISELDELWEVVNGSNPARFGQVSTRALIHQELLETGLELLIA
jgi:hypothetical protein